MLTLLQTSSLEKILPKLECNAEQLKKLSVLSGERSSYQIGYSSTEFDDYTFDIKSDISEHISVYDVKNVPVQVPTNPDAVNDKNYLSHEPGMFPDALILKRDNLINAANWYKSLWLVADSNTPSGKHNISVTFTLKPNPDKKPSGEKPITVELELNVANVSLPDQELIFTQWFHTDCISAYYNVPSLSEKHWELIEKFLKMAVDNGINMILTPIFTPPLDTEIGGERPTVQLIKITKTEDIYEFDFTDLKRWISVCKGCGVKYFEMAHLFTQWGANFTPKIMAEENGEYKRIFGWDIAATDVKYSTFLSQLLPSLEVFFVEEGIKENVYFHISDEPCEKNIENYKAAKSVAAKYLKSFKIIDALSDYEFYKSGAVEHAIPAIDSMELFIENNVPDLWTYYCSAHYTGVSNRFIAMPEYRNRYIGFQLYKYNIKGFLHWGYNYYYSFLSKRLVNPFFETDAGEVFPSGDSFSVYPDINGPAPSIRLFVFFEALQDLRAMKLLEKFIGHERVVEILEEELKDKITFSKCADNAQTVLSLRNRINIEILKNTSKNNL